MSLRSVTDYSFFTVDSPVSGELAREILDLWTKSAGLTDEQAKKRLTELILYVRDGSGQIIGVATAGKTYFQQIQNYVYAYRCFIEPEARVPALDTQMIVRTKDFLQKKSEQETENRCVGILTIVQNEVIKQNWKQAIWLGADMIYVGNTPEGHHIRIGYFKNAMI